mgnify:FL=1|jgi:hypothetical protein|tara:strand:- start:857 stop:1093 length:237 start_codon:yes stop_codon:yes gene_type:complete
MREIDTHNMLHSEAVEYVEDVVLEESLKSKLFSVRVITGNSQRLQKRIQREVCRKHKLKSEIPINNLGTMIIYETKII